MVAEKLDLLVNESRRLFTAAVPELAGNPPDGWKLAEKRQWDLIKAGYYYVSPWDTGCPDLRQAPLTRILTGLLTAASKQPGIPQRWSLSRELRVDVVIAERTGSHNQIHLQLSREDKYPSDKEWSTVLAFWPGGGIQGIEPMRLVHLTRCYLKAVWDVE